jgi:hypothetical protein
MFSEYLPPSFSNQIKELFVAWDYGLPSQLGQKTVNVKSGNKAVNLLGLQFHVNNKALQLRG